MTERERLLDELRPVSYGIAYRMLGSVSEAEDVLQEALLRVHQALDGGEQLASRQLASRARKHAEQRRPRFQTTREHRDELAARSSPPSSKAISPGSTRCSCPTWS